MAGRRGRLVCEDEDDDDDDDDDCFSLCSQDSDGTGQHLIATWAAQLKQKKKGGKGKRKGESRGKSTSTNHLNKPPPGRAKEKWMARTP
jgi:hypothetical protein